MEWVCPPQTSITTHRRVTVRRISATSFWASAWLRNSFTYFILSQEVHQCLKIHEGAGGFLFVHLADGEAHVHQHVFPRQRIGQVGHTGFARDAAEIHRSEERRV